MVGCALSERAKQLAGQQAIIIMQNIKQQLMSIYRSKQKQKAKNTVFVLLQKNTKYALKLYLILQRVGRQ
jgi:hypothetical protein